MKMRITFIAVTAALLVASGALAAGCGGNGGGSLTLDEFFQRVEAIDDELEARTAELDVRFEELTDESGGEELAELFRDQGNLIEEFVDGLAELDPPDVAGDVHNEAVSAGRAVLAAFEDLIDEAAEAATIDEFFDVFDSVDFQAAVDRFTQACLDAEQLAADSDITVDLDCNEE